MNENHDGQGRFSAGGGSGAKMTVTRVMVPRSQLPPAIRAALSRHDAKVPKAKVAKAQTIKSLARKEGPRSKSAVARRDNTMRNALAKAANTLDPLAAFSIGGAWK